MQYIGFCRNSKQMQLAPSKKGGMQTDKNQQLYLPLHISHSLHSQTHFLLYKFEIFVHSNDCIHGDWWLYFPKDLVFTQKENMHMEFKLWRPTRKAKFGVLGNKPNCMGR